MMNDRNSKLFPVCFFVVFLKEIDNISYIHCENFFREWFTNPRAHNCFFVRLVTYDDDVL